MRTTIRTIKPAGDIALMSTYEAKLSLKISSETDDEMIEQIVRNQSDVVAMMANRVFAREEIVETFYDTPDTSGSLLLSRWPVQKIVSVNDEAQLVESVDFDIDSRSGRLSLLSGLGYWGSPVSVQYVGGYLLPFEAPPALKQALILLIREAYYAAARGDASVRMVGHKDSRVIYFDPNSALKALGGGSGGGSSAQKAAMAIIRKFMRIEV